MICFKKGVNWEELFLKTGSFYDGSILGADVYHEPDRECGGGHALCTRSEFHTILTKVQA